MADGILRLNDHCLLEIFKRISLLDLANFKKIYGQLGAVADIAFFKSTRGLLYFGYEKKIDENLRIIKGFGPSIDGLIIDYKKLSGRSGTKWSNIFRAINKRCGKTLKEFTLCGEAVRQVTGVHVSLIGNILKNIETLKIGDYAPIELIDNLAYCKNARSITLFCTVDIDLHPTIFRTNKNLLQLKLFKPIHDKHLKTIVDNLMNSRLEELAVMINMTKSSSQNIVQLLRFNYLKRLYIDCCDVNLDFFLLNLDSSRSLSVLSLSGVRLDEANIATLGRIARLKVLKLKFCNLVTSSPFESLLILCGNMNIEHLVLTHAIHLNRIDEENFLAMIETRKASTAKNCLHLTLDYQIYSATLKAISSQLLEANKEQIKFIYELDLNYENKFFDEFFLYELRSKFPNPFVNMNCM